jgi:hypothetical protein
VLAPQISTNDKINTHQLIVFIISHHFKENLYALWARKKVKKLKTMPIPIVQGILSSGPNPVFGRPGIKEFPVFGKPGEFVNVVPPILTDPP